MVTPTLLVGGLVAAAMAWAIGAQDVSNALGTSVGSKALTVKQAIVVGAICEFSGSLVGGDVASTISGGVLDLNSFAMETYAQIMLATMAGASLWLVVATIYSLPVSTTHSLIGALIGIGCWEAGAAGINWSGVGAIGKATLVKEGCV
jgi:inorganic phosphate transporter, PiT family